jgi:hypothetical protein
MAGAVKTNEFMVKTDGGEQYTIIEYTDVIPAGSFQDPKKEVPGLKTLMTSDGQHVNYREDGTYEIVESGKIARKIKERTGKKLEKYEI